MHIVLESISVLAMEHLDTEELGILRKESIRQRMVAFQKGASAGEAAVARRRYLKRATVHEAQQMTGGGASARKRGATSCAQRAGNLRDAVINHFASALACLNLLRQRSVSVCVLVEDVRFTETNAKDSDRWQYRAP